MLRDSTVPVQALMPQTAQTVLTVAMAALGLASIVYAVHESHRRRDLVPVFLVIGAGLAVFYEPLGDALVKVYYTERGQDTWISTFGRDIPVFIGLLYFWYMPAGAYFLLRKSEHGISPRVWWTRWAGFLTFAITFEMLVLTVAGTPWIYHGDQAFKVLDVPVLTPFTYVSFDVTIALGVCAMARFLPRSRHWLIVPAVPMLMVFGHAATSLPLAIALHSDTSSDLAIAAGALGSAALAVVLSWIASYAFRNPWPAAADDRTNVLEAHRGRLHRMRSRGAAVTT
jgi:hypothetical protein